MFRATCLMTEWRSGADTQSEKSGVGFNLCAGAEGSLATKPESALPPSLSGLQLTQAHRVLQYGGPRGPGVEEGNGGF